MVIFSPWLLGIPFILGGKIYDRFDKWRYPANSAFDSRRFASKDLKFRYVSLEDTLKNHLKRGMSSDEVRNLLGPPDSITPSGDWQYETRRPGWTLIDWNGGGISVSFTPEHTLLSAEDNRWVD